MDEDTGILSHQNTAWLEKEVLNGLRLWHVIGIAIFSILSVIVLLCCCFRFRIPRTKQEIEADYQRRKIVKKFRKRIQKFENCEMDAEMDLKKAALEKIRADFANEKHKSSDNSSESNDESHYDGNRTGTKKKRLISVPKRDQLIQTIYTGYDNNSEAPLSLETDGA
ncbi:CLUMA_CG000191, isoform A [Clunio marinus]|uniref:CLUMA_CG000191, isoform A n=1 Tax=Clunio marinus TaxID=568069 RepID=A0A1J1HG77_9DIPT|nr:CLUMA_CG000191, isoform A [Clunio marinus]